VRGSDDLIVDDNNAPVGTEGAHVTIKGQKYGGTLPNCTSPTDDSLLVAKVTPA
jgi:hypothetical protein